MTPVLHGYWRSGTTYRTRIALNLKGLAYETRGVDLLGGAQREPGFLALNPQGLVPALESDDGVLTQSVAILEWLEETHPDPPLLPARPADRATVRAMVGLVACDIHPLNNLRVLTAIRELGADADAAKAWSARWIGAGFTALEQQVQRNGDGWCFGDRPTLADCCLIPQLYSAQRFEVDLSPYPALTAISARAAAHPAFIAAHPDRQPDAR